MDINISIDTADEERIKAAFLTDRWTPTVPGAKGEEVENPVSADDFIKGLIVNYISQVVSDYERSEALKAVAETEPASLKTADAVAAATAAKTAPTPPSK